MSLVNPETFTLHSIIKGFKTKNGCRVVAGVLKESDIK
jgi:hypothetical protein